MKHFPDLFTLISGNRRPLARAAGSTIYQDELPCVSRNLKLERKALDQLVRQRLLEAEALRWDFLTGVRNAEL
jgi:hypothetical protein